MKSNIDNKTESKNLIDKGLSDENLLKELTKFKINNPSLQKRKYPLQMYDKVNLMCRAYMDRLARFEMDYDFEVDTEIFLNTAVCCLESFPQLHSQVIYHPVSPYWKVADYNVNDFVTVKYTDDIEKEREDFFRRRVPLKSNIQMNIGLFISEGRTYICFIWNHMCMDGGGLKSFLNDMFKGYDSYMKNGTVSVFYSGKSRAYECVYDDMSEADRKTAKKLFAAVSSKDNHTLPFTEAKDSDKKMLVRKKIGADVFEPARLKAKECGATANDLISAAYIRAFYDVSGCDEKERVGISSAVDLRRYIKHPEKIGYTNHTAFTPCIVESKGGTMADTLKAVAKSTTEAKRDKFMGLHGQPLLNLGFSTMIYAQAELITSLGYTNANLSVSNVGAMKPELLAFDGIVPTSVWVGGGAKEKPCAALNVLSYNGDLMLTTCIRGNESDRKMLANFFDRIEENLKLL